MTRKYLLPILLCFIVFIAQTPEVLAGVSDAAVLFLRIAPNARSAGMGEAFIAVDDDASATHWNPAGLGKYPLADSWYQFKLSDDTHLKKLALKALKKELPANFSEKIVSWQFEGNQLSRFDNGEWHTSEQISIDPSRTVLENLSRLAVTSDKDLFKMVVREVAKENVGMSFKEINDTRLELLKSVSKQKVIGQQVNQLMEKMITYWQDLRFNVDSFIFFKEKVNFLNQDGEIDNNELSELVEHGKKVEIAKRPKSIKVPYTILLTNWRSFEVPWEQRIEKIAVMENNIPNANYMHYDIWALTNFGLMRFDGENWFDGDDINPRKGDKISDIVARALGTNNPEILNPKIELVAHINNEISREKLAEIKSVVEPLIGEDYTHRAELMDVLSKLDEKWLNCLLDNNKSLKIVEAYNSAWKDSSLNDTELDRIYFAIDRSFKEKITSLIRFPFKTVFDGKINDINVYKRTLYVATDKGLFSYNGRRWQKLNTTGSTDSTENVWCIEVEKRGSIWIGTDSGVKHYMASKWESYGIGHGITSVPIKHLFVKNEKMVWAAADRDLFYYDGTSWSKSFKYVTTVSDSLHTLFQKIYGPLDQNQIKMEEAKFLAKYRDFKTDPKAGLEVEVQFKPIFEANITALVMDKKNTLWVGTELGVKRFDGKSWYSFGYKPIKVEKSMTPEQLATDYLKTDDPETIAGFVNVIKKKNTISRDSIKAGTIIYVYANPAGSPINTLCNFNGKIFVGSLYGTFFYDDGVWERYYHDNLHRLNTKDIEAASGELWLATADRVIVFAHARKELSFTHANWLPDLASDLYYEFLSYVQPISGLGTVGINLTFLSYGEIARTTEFSSEIVESFHSFDGALTLSYGTRASKNMAVGLSAKIIYSRLSPQGAGAEIGQGTGTSFAVEAGLLYSVNKRLVLGASLTNLGPDMSYIDAAQSDPLPRNVAAGFAYKLLDSPYNTFTIVGEVNKLIATLTDDFSTEIKEMIYNVGAEYWYGSLMALRAGYIYDQEGQIKTPTLGLGLQLKSRYRIDFAYIPSSENLPLANTLRSSLTFRW